MEKVEIIFLLFVFYHFMSGFSSGMISVSLKVSEESIKHMIYSAAELKKIDLARKFGPFIFIFLLLLIHLR